MEPNKPAGTPAPGSPTPVNPALKSAPAPLHPAATTIPNARPQGPTAPRPAGPAPTTVPANADAGTPRVPAQMPPAAPPAAVPNKIQHVRPAIGRFPEESDKPSNRMLGDLKPLPVAEPAGPLGGGGGKITAFGKERRHEDSWSRTPNTTGNGAIHVKTFHCKLTDDALVYMDQAINEWLDAHPQYEVKFVSSTIGTMTGKLKEPALFCQVWV